MSGVGDTRFLEAFCTQVTGIADTAGLSFRARVVAGYSQGIVHTQSYATANDLGLAQVDQRGMDVEAIIFNTCPGCHVCESFEGFYEYRPAIGIPGIIDGIGPDENIPGTGSFSQPQRHGQEDRVTRRHIGNRDICFARRGRIWDIDLHVSQGGATQFTNRQSKDAVIRRSALHCHSARSLEFYAVALAVIKTQCDAAIAGIPGDGQHSR